MAYGVLVNGVDVSDYIYNLRYNINQDALQVSGGCESDLEFEINDEIALFEDGVLRFKARIKSREKEIMMGWKPYYRYEFAFTFQNLKRGVIKISKEEHEGGQTKDFLENILNDAGIDYTFIGGVNSTSIIFETMSPEASTISVAPNLAAQGLSFTENWAYFIKDNKLYITDSDLSALPHEDLIPQELINPKIRKVNKVATKGKFVAIYNAFSTSFNSSGDAAAYGEQKLEQNLTFLNEKNAENVQNNFSMFSYPFTVLEFELDRFLDPLKFYRIMIVNKPEFADILGDYYIQEEEHEFNEGRVDHKYKLKQFKAYISPQNHISFVIFHQRGGRRIQAFGGGGGSGVNILSKVGQMNSTLPTAADAGKIEATGQTSGGGALPEIDKTATFLMSMTNAENMQTEWRQMQIFGLEDDGEFVKASEDDLQKGYGLITSTLSLPSGEYSLVWTFGKLGGGGLSDEAENKPIVFLRPLNNYSTNANGYPIVISHDVKLLTNYEDMAYLGDSENNVAVAYFRGQSVSYANDEHHIEKSIVIEADDSTFDDNKYFKEERYLHFDATGQYGMRFAYEKETIHNEYGNQRREITITKQADLFEIRHEAARTDVNSAYRAILSLYSSNPDALPYDGTRAALKGEDVYNNMVGELYVSGGSAAFEFTRNGDTKEYFRVGSGDALLAGGSDVIIESGGDASSLTQIQLTSNVDKDYWSRLSLDSGIIMESYYGTTLKGRNIEDSISLGYHNEGIKLYSPIKIDLNTSGDVNLKPGGTLYAETSYIDLESSDNAKIKATHSILIDATDSTLHGSKISLDAPTLEIFDSNQGIMRPGKSEIVSAIKSVDFGAQTTQTIVLEFVNGIFVYSG